MELSIREWRPGQLVHLKTIGLVQVEIQEELESEQSMLFNKHGAITEKSSAILAQYQKTGQCQHQSEDVYLN